jgi:magnesium-transporting ATPase (P-type)
MSLLTGILLTIASLGAYLVELDAGPIRARTIAFAIVVAGSLWLIFAERVDGRPIWSRPRPAGARFWGVWWLVALSLVAILSVHGLARLAGMSALGWREWMLVLGTSLPCVAWRALGTGARGSKADPSSAR